MSKIIKVLVVDDSAIVRKILSETIDANADMKVIGTAPDPYVARDKILAHEPDVLTLDIEMPRMDGITFLKRLMQYRPTPTIVISSLGQASCTAALEALRSGAVDVLAKPTGPYSVGELRHSLGEKIRAAARSKMRAEPPPLREPRSSAFSSTCVNEAYRPECVVAIGASTGGTVAIQNVLASLPSNIPGTIITQHIPEGFSQSFANRLNSLCRMDVKEAAQGDRLQPGLVLIAPGNRHLLLKPVNGQYMVDLQSGPPVCYQRPSVDVMFSSVARVVGASAIGVLLTGMGTDGAMGMLALRKQGAHTLAQDEDSCVVYGMPREAVRLNAVDRVVPLPEMPSAILAALRSRRNTTPVDQGPA